MSRLIRVFTVCLVILFFIPIIELCNKQGDCPNLAVCPNVPDFTLVFVRSSGNQCDKSDASNGSRVKSGNFGHQVNSDIHLQTVELQISL